jgi:hypothetical protein
LPATDDGNGLHFLSVLGLGLFRYFHSNKLLTGITQTHEDKKNGEGAVTNEPVSLLFHPSIHP